MPLTKKKVVKICFNKTTFHPNSTMSYKMPSTSNLLSGGLEAANQHSSSHEAQISYHWIFFLCGYIYKNIFYSQKFHIYVLYERIGSPAAADALEIPQLLWQILVRLLKCVRKLCGLVSTLQCKRSPYLSYHKGYYVNFDGCIRYNKMITLERSVFI